MPDWDSKFKAEYDYAKGWLDKDQSYAEEWRPLVRRLNKLMQPDGFDAGQATALSDLRSMVQKGPKLISLKKVTEDETILRAVGAWTASGNGTLDPEAKMRAAALKLLRHVYLVNKSGNRKAWVVALPKALQNWPSDDFNARVSSEISARILLRSNDEIFSSERRKYLGTSTYEAMAWCQRAGIVLANAVKAASGKAENKGVDAVNVVKRWFADPATSVVDLQSYIGTLSQGLKNIIAMLNRGHFVLTDWVPLRNASTQDEIDFLNSEAFTFASRSEGMDVVYIEKSFFVDHPGSVLNSQKNWTRIVVHELSHLVCGTEDVNIGNARYAWYGIGPHAGYPGSEAIKNADNWAFFCADCAGVLTDGERTTALKII